MSLIADALKTAQREKSRRESPGSRPVSAAVLVPLRTKPRAGPNWRRTLTMSGAGAVVIAGAAFLLLGGRKKSPLPAVPPLTSTILSQAIASDSANRVEPRPDGPRVASSPRGASPAAVTPPLRAAAASSRGVGQGPRSTARGDRAAILQGQPASDSAASSGARDVQSTGRLRIAVELPRQPEAARLFSEAVAAHRAGDLATARALYERVLMLAPNDADALNNLGVLLSAQRDFDRALGLLRRAASISPRSAGVWNNIGTVFREHGKSSDAIAAYRHALTLEPGHQGATVGLAQQYLAISALAQAREMLDRVLTTNPALAEAQYTLGQVLELQGDRAGAIRAYSAFIKVAPPRLAAHIELVRRRVETLSRAP